MICRLQLVLVLTLVSAVSQAALVTPYAAKGPLAVRGVALSATNVPRWGQVMLTPDIAATFDNPFDPDDIAVDALVTTPSGSSYTIPGFFTRPFQREDVNGKEKLTATGAPHWKIRLMAAEVGQHTVRVRVRDRSGTVESMPIRFSALQSTNPGLVLLSLRDRRYFEFTDGSAYYPVGANVCWAYGRGTYDYDGWFSGYATNGGNYGRLWLSPHWSTFALERPGKAEQGFGMGQYDLANAWRLDYVLDLAAAKGMRLMLCIDSYNILRQKDGYPQWDNTPHNAANGGPLHHPTEFWTNAVMDKLYRDKLRYLVARYAANAAVLSWEFWNEVDITTGYKTAPVKAWHARMAAALRELDPYHHLITTSFAGTKGDKEIDALPGLDYVQTHHYNSPDLALTVARAQEQKVSFEKPHVVGEIGADSGGPRAKDDPTGLQVHDPQWVSLVTGCAGSAQPWWWDNLIHPRGLYPLFGAVARFAQGIDWPGEQFRTQPPRIQWQNKPDSLPRKDLVFTGGPTSWEASEFNRPRTVQVTRFGASGDLPLAGIQHGVSNHPREHNPVTFETDLPWPTTLEFSIGDVSGYGGAALRVTLDSNVILTVAFPVPAGNKAGTLKQYAGVHRINVPTGKHVLVVENTGADWFMTDYRFRNAVERAAPPLVTWANVGRTTALLWARVEDRTWRRVCVDKQPVAPCPATIVTLNGLAPGKWRAEFWDTWAGKITAEKQIDVPASGDALIALPEIATDLAVKLRKQ